MNTKNPEKIVRIATLATLSFMICWGLVLVVAQVKPFWVDEWRVIYNLKFKTAAAIWGPLDFMQQFPRVYIEIIKAFTSLFDYSYFTLRLPSYLVGSFAIFFCYRLANRIYGTTHFNRFLFVMILVSCSTFTEYFVQVKQYTMDILLSLVAIWQLLELLGINDSAKMNRSRYIMLCASLLIVPFFSYTYPIAIAPAFVVLLVQSIYMVRTAENKTSLKKVLLLKWLPSLFSVISIVTFYVTDVSQLMRDQQMQGYWGALLMEDGFHWQSFFLNIWMLFAEIGSGFVFWWLLGLLGTASFVYGLRSTIKDLARKTLTGHALIRLYSIVLLAICILLFAAGKLPLGEPRLNAFTIPAISILIIHFLDRLREKTSAKRFSFGLSVLLYVGVIGNIYTTFVASITGPEYARKLDIYHSTETAIVMAQAQNLPIFITPEVAYPYDKTQNLPFKTTVPGDWVLKTFPAYKVLNNIPVYAVNDTNSARQAIKKLPSYITAVMIGDGRSYHITNR